MFPDASPFAKHFICTLALFTAAACGSDQASPPMASVQSPSPSQVTSTLTPTGGAESASVESPSESSMVDELNPREQHLMSLLSSLGLTGVGIAEHGFKNADVSATYEGVEVFVREYGAEFPATPGVVVSDLSLGAVEGALVSTTTVGQLLRFSCGQSVFEVIVPPSAADSSADAAGDVMEADISRLMLTQLDC